MLMFAWAAAVTSSSWTSDRISSIVFSGAAMIRLFDRRSDVMCTSSRKPAVDRLPPGPGRPVKNRSEVVLVVRPPPPVVVVVAGRAAVPGLPAGRAGVGIRPGAAVVPGGTTPLVIAVDDGVGQFVGQGVLEVGRSAGR